MHTFAQCTRKHKNVHLYVHMYNEPEMIGIEL